MFYVYFPVINLHWTSVSAHMCLCHLSVDTWHACVLGSTKLNEIKQNKINRTHIITVAMEILQQILKISSDKFCELI